MQNRERQKFEENWKSAFDGAEMTPPDRLWSSIEVELAGQESAAMKKRVVFYQRLAAATVLFALLSGVYAFYPKGEGKLEAVAKKEVVKPEDNRSQETGVRSQETGVRSQETGARSQEEAPKNESVTKNESVAKNDITSNSSHNNPSHNNSSHTLGFKPKIVPKHVVLSDKPVLTEAIAAQFETQNTDLTVADNDVAEASKTTNAEEKTETAVVSPLLQTTPEVASLEEEPEEIVEPKRKASRESTWLALGAAAGNYAPNTPTATAPAADQYSYYSGFGPQINAASPSPPRPKAEPKIGSSYSVGMAVGKKFGRIVLQTGVNLAKQQYEYTSNYDSRSNSNVAKAASMDYIMTESANMNANALTVTNEYTVNSTMEVVSIPVQAGYMIIDRRLAWQVNAGFSPDFFLRNILVDKSGQREKFTQAAGSDSPYRSVNWSGLANTEISYRVGTHYRLSLVPGVRYSFNSILKESANSGRPVILDVGFRFKYLFD